MPSFLYHLLERLDGEGQGLAVNVDIMEGR